MIFVGESKENNFFRDRVFSRWRERLFFLTADSLISIDTEGRRLGDHHAFLEVAHAHDGDDHPESVL